MRSIFAGFLAALLVPVALYAMNGQEAEKETDTWPTYYRCESSFKLFYAAKKVGRIAPHMTIVKAIKSRYKPTAHELGVNTLSIGNLEKIVTEDKNGMTKMVFILQDSLPYARGFQEWNISFPRASLENPTVQGRFEIYDIDKNGRKDILEEGDLSCTATETWEFRAGNS